jgi:hypothetical protein
MGITVEKVVSCKAKTVNIYSISTGIASTKRIINNSWVEFAQFHWGEKQLRYIILRKLKEDKVCTLSFGFEAHHMHHRRQRTNIELQTLSQFRPQSAKLVHDSCLSVQFMEKRAIHFVRSSQGTRYRNTVCGQPIMFLRRHGNGIR